MLIAAWEYVTQSIENISIKQTPTTLGMDQVSPHFTMKIGLHTPFVRHKLSSSCQGLFWQFGHTLVDVTLWRARWPL